MKEEGSIWMNGTLVPFGEAKVHVLTHALHYATAVFEGLRCYRTEKGSAIFRLGDHVARLFESAKIYSMKMPYTREEVDDAILLTVRESGLEECYIRPIAYYGYGEMGLTPSLNSVDVAVACWEWKMGESKAGKFSGARCMVSSWTRIDSRMQPMRAKSAANYANAALARLEALDNGYDEAIMLNAAGKVTEGSAENIFILKDGVVSTPPLDSGILKGITRDSVIRILEAEGYGVLVRDMDRDDLYTADEIFLVGTAAEVKSVSQVDRVRIGDGNMGEMTKRLQSAYLDAATGRDGRFSSWLRYV